MMHPMDTEAENPSQRIEHVLREESRHVLGALVRRFGRFELAEDAVQEALIVASQEWPVKGVPEEPRSWLIRVGYRRMIDLLRSEQASRRREEEAIYADPVLVDPTRTGPAVVDHDDSLHLLLLCCHPALSEVSRVALTLRAVGGLTTGEIAHAYGTAEETDWPQIAALYLWLERLQPTAPVRLSRAVAVAQAFGPRRGLALLEQLDHEHQLSDDPLVAQRTHAVRAHLLDRLGDHDRASYEFRAAAALAENEAESRYLLQRARRS